MQPDICNLVYTKTLFAILKATMVLHDMIIVLYYKQTPADWNYKKGSLPKGISDVLLYLHKQTGIQCKSTAAITLLTNYM